MPGTAPPDMQFAIAGRDGDAHAAGFRRMRRVATALLVAMAALYILARTNEPLHPAIGFVRAFAEAGMVGGLADWFAVTALFRHPLGLPIPHTAIIPTNKDRIGDTLASFLRSNFLIPHVVARRMAGFDLAGQAGRFLSHPAGGEGRLRRGAARLFADLLASLDDRRLGNLVRAGFARRLEEIDAAPLLATMLEAVLAEGRHRPLIGDAVRWASATLRANEELIRQTVHERANAIMRWTGLDERLANGIIDGLDGLLAEMAADPDHPMRARADAALQAFAGRLRDDSELRARIAEGKAALLANPALADWWNGVWERMRQAMIRMARDPDAAAAGQLGAILTEFGRSLMADGTLKTQVNRFGRRAVVGLTSAYGDAIVRLVSDTVRGWDARTITDRVENAVGRDLQYIRINGTLVGGLVGVGLHALGMLL